MKKIGLIVCTLLFSSFVATTASAEENAELADDAKSAILIERDTGAILYEKNIHEKLPPASMTKIMTMLLIMEAIDKGQIQLNEKVRTSEYAASMGGSQIFLEPGEEMTVKDLLKSIAIASANDASVALAEKIAGSEQAFVKMMNKKAAELKLKNTKFQNTTGLSTDDHYSSAYDMAIMAKELLKYEDITKFTKIYEDYLREDTDKKFWLVNTNKLVKFYPGADGLKTGFTKEAKYCLTATAKKDDMRVIAVIFGAQDPKGRNAQITSMMDYAFSQYKTHPFYKKGEKLAKIKVNKGHQNDVHAVTSESISVLTKKGQQFDKLKQEININKKQVAPIKKGDKVGTLIIKKGDKVLIESDLLAEKEIKKANWWQLYKKSLGMMTKSS